jgi:hypothetical protein
MPRTFERDTSPSLDLLELCRVRLHPGKNQSGVMKR